MECDCCNPRCAPRFWEVLDIHHPLGGVRHESAQSKHGWLPWKKLGSGSIKGITYPVHIEFRDFATISKGGMGVLTWLPLVLVNRRVSVSITDGKGNL